MGQPIGNVLLLCHQRKATGQAVTKFVRSLPVEHCFARAHTQADHPDFTGAVGNSLRPWRLEGGREEPRVNAADWACTRESAILATSFAAGESAVWCEARRDAGFGSPGLLLEGVPVRSL